MRREERWRDGGWRRKPDASPRAKPQGERSGEGGSLTAKGVSCYISRHGLVSGSELRGCKSGGR